MLDLTAVYEVVIFSIGDTKAGTKMGKLQLKNKSDETVLNCILWEEALTRIDSKVFRTGNLVKIQGGSYNEKYNNCLVSSLELIKEAGIGLSEKKREEIFNQITEYVNKIKDNKLKEFVSALIFENEEKFKTTPAAKLMHHNYIGGLLQHTFECLELADKVLPLLSPQLDKDEVYAACILHDFGKIFEYKVDMESGLIDYEEDFRKDWLSHSQWGFSLCMQNGFLNIAKMIAAHHARPEWGSLIDLAQRDVEPIVYIIHHIDDLSAKYGKISITDIAE